jgi:hypothetical protein
VSTVLVEVHWKCEVAGIVFLWRFIFITWHRINSVRYFGTISTCFIKEVTSSPSYTCKACNPVRDCLIWEIIFIVLEKI